MKRSLVPTGGGFKDPFDMLTGCHERIRSFTGLAQRIATQPAPAEQVVEAAERLRLYFGTALPLHEQDEEQTLFEAMRSADAPGMDALFARLREEHRVIEGVLHGLLPAWKELTREPGLVAAHRAALTEGGEALAAAFAPHLAMEEDELFPLARRSLADDVLASMLRAMLARRQPVIDDLRVLHAGAHGP